LIHLIYVVMILSSPFDIVSMAMVGFNAGLVAGLLLLLNGHDETRWSTGCSQVRSWQLTSRSSLHRYILIILLALRLRQLQELVLLAGFGSC
jgi:hypothetical protein